MKVPCEVMQAFRPRQDGQIMGLELLSIAIGACSNLAVARVSHSLPCKAFALFMIKFVEEISSFGPTTKGQSVPREKVAHQLESPSPPNYSGAVVCQAQPHPSTIARWSMPCGSDLSNYKLRCGSKGFPPKIISPTTHQGKLFCAGAKQGVSHFLCDQGGIWHHAAHQGKEDRSIA